MKTRGKVLFVDTVHPLIREELTKAGFQCEYFAHHTYEDYKKIISEYTGIIIRSKIKLDENILSKALQLKFIGRVGAGMENIDVEYAVSKGISCLNSPEGSRDAVGEHAVGLLLSLLRNIPRSHNQVRHGEWVREANRGTEIKGKTIGIIGYGNMGSSFAEKISGFGAKVLAYDKYKKNFGNRYVQETNMQSIFMETDILSLHVPLTEETTHLFNRDYLSNFRKNIVLLNTARGMNVNTTDLVQGLTSGKVTGAALDVLEYEDKSFEKLDRANLPDPFQYLVKADNVILTSHIAGWTIESKYKLAQVLVDKVLESGG